MGYKQMSFSERENISRMLAQNISNEQIAKRLDRHRSTIGREVKRLGRSRKTYRAIDAQNDMKSKKQLSRKGSIKIKEALEALIQYRIVELHWSPEQVSSSLKIKFPTLTQYHVSHETIYTWIYNHTPCEKRELLTKGLRRKKKRRGLKRKGQGRKGAIIGGTSIHKRPKEIEKRLVPGHWEGDFIIGKDHQSAILTLVERMTRYLIMIPLGHKKDAETVRHRLVELFGKMPSDMKKSLTYDRGSELSKHKAITEESGVPIYFADPGSPWQRGTNENTNGLIRCYLPKGSDFTQYTLQEIDEIQNRLNSRPRKCLGFQSPKNLLNELNYCPA